ncbi:phage baseplate plug family protein [Campylobacter mucosalis]|uniref:phage baseplate plug family protein n=1 Tax=Campylobacter mucosalis TaxID=202 RepID=UPI00146FD9BE|nr:hypothetical protein [Campylobacter mucosalis]
MYLLKTTSEKIQTQSFELYGLNLELTLKFNDVGLTWQFDLANSDTGEIYAQNRGLSVNAPSLIHKNLPFVFMLIDESKNGINCIHHSELGKRLKLYAVSKTDFKNTMRELYKEQI